MIHFLSAYATLLTALVAILTGTTVLWHKYLRPAYRMVKRVTEAADRLIPFAEEQLRPNGGSSLADKINKIATNHAVAEEHWERLETGQAGLAMIVEQHHNDVTTRLAAIESKQ